MESNSIPNAIQRGNVSPAADMEETKRLLVENSHLPMSIILVGVGRGDMSKMDILDDDNRTMSWNGRRSERDIVQFVEMSKYLPDQTN